MTLRRTLIGIFAVSAAVVLCDSNGADAIELELLKIVGDETPVPDTGLTFGEPGTSNGGISHTQLSGERVAFQGWVGPKAAPTHEGLYVWERGSVTTIADTNTLVPGQTWTFDDFHRLSYESGVAAFRAEGNGLPGIYGWGGGILWTVADTGTQVPGQAPGTTFTDFAEPWFCDSMMVVFRGYFSGGEGIYLRVESDPLIKIADTSTPIPGGVGNFTALGGASPFVGVPAVDAGVVAFYGVGSDSVGLYQSFLGGPLSVIADANTNVPGLATTFTDFFSARPVTIADGLIVFAGQYDGGAGIYLLDGAGLSTVVDVTTTIANTGETLDSMGGQGIGFDGVSVAFTGGTPTSVPVFTTAGGSLWEVARDGVFTEGEVALGTYPQGFDGHTLTFVGADAWLATDAYHWRGGDGNWSDADRWQFGLIPGTVVPTVVNSASPAIIVGPSASTALRSVELGTSGETVTLQLQPLGTLEMEYMVIGTGGTLAGTGTIVSTQVTNQGLIALSDSSIVSVDGFDNAGRIELSGANGEVQGAVANGADGAIHAQSEVVATFQDGLQNAGTLEVDPGATVILHSDSVAGSSEGGGTIELQGSLLVQETIAIANDVRLGSSATLRVRLEGTTPGTEHGQLTVSGAVTLAGTLVLERTDYMPQPADAITLITHDTVDGQFSEIEDSGGFAWRIESTANATTLVPVTCYADGDGDGVGAGAAFLPDDGTCDADDGEAETPGDCADDDATRTVDCAEEMGGCGCQIRATHASWRGFALVAVAFLLLRRRRRGWLS